MAGQLSSVHRSRILWLVRALGLRVYTSGPKAVDA